MRIDICMAVAVIVALMALASCAKPPSSLDAFCDQSRQAASALAASALKAGNPDIELKSLRLLDIRKAACA